MANARMLIMLDADVKAKFQEVCAAGNTTPADTIAALTDRIQAGDIELRDGVIIGHYEGSQIESTPIDISPLIRAAQRYRVTPESLLDSMIRRCCP